MSSKKVIETAINPKSFPLFLYKRILRLHYGLPSSVRVMGDIYVKDEFRRHKEASPQHTIVFLNEWTNYCATLSKQLSSSGIVRGFIGKDLTPEKLDSFADEQLKQLLDLKMEATKVISTGTVLPKGDKHEKETGKTFDPKIPMIR